jgi:subtilisin family serine protease
MDRESATDERTGRYLVLFASDDSDAAMRTLFTVAGISDVAVAQEFSEEPATPDQVSRGAGIFLNEIGVAVLSVEPDQAEGLVTASHEGQAILAVEPEHYLYYEVPGSFPWDESTVSWGLQAIGVPSSSYSGKGVGVAVLDTGIYLAHPDLTERVEMAQSFVAGQSVEDANGHGTHCAGLACGPKTPHHPTRYGVAYDASLLIAKVMGDNGRGEEGTALMGIRWAVANGCRVVSMSMSRKMRRDTPHSDVFEATAQRLLRRGIVMVAAAGNQSSRADSVIAPVGSPANCPSVVAVGAVDENLKVADFSNGSVGQGAIDICAPGVNVLSSYVLKDGYRHARGQGTSIATPLVAGVLALLAEAYPDAIGTDLVKNLKEGARGLQASPSDVGVGIVQAP